MRTRHRITLAALLLFALAARAYASDDSSVTGMVADSSGKPVGNATVTLQNASGKAMATVQTDANGHFTLAHVDPGSYAIVVSAPGFASGSSIATITPAQQNPVSIVLAKSDTLDVQVNAQRLNRARNDLLPETGSSVYRFSQSDISDLPAGQNTPLNQVLLQAPGVASDSFGQLHVRGDHANLQYRINGIIIPEPISGFGQSLDTRIIDQMNLLTGALPAQYGYRTAGIVDIRTKTGDDGSGGSIDVFGGSHQTIRTSGDVFGSRGPFSYYFSGAIGENNLGIENPTSSASPLHDHTREGNAFGYMSYIINPLTRVSVMFGVASNQFQIPNTPGLTPSFALNGVNSFDSSQLNETQSELNQFAAIALQGTNGGALDYQLAFVTRYSRTQFNPDPIGDLLFNGVASKDFHSDTANGLQFDTTYRLNDKHTIRAGVFAQQEHAVFDNDLTVFPVDENGNQSSDQPLNIPDASSKTGYLYSAYVQDEWKATSKLTINYGLRYDKMDEYVSASQLSPRVGVVYALTPSTTVHAGYARYFTPPAFELVSNADIARFAGTTAQVNGQNDPVQPERSHYFDLGITQQITPALSVGLDAYYKKSTNLLDEGQFGTALIFTPFNYQYGRVYGVELTTNYRQGNVSAYANVALSRAQGKNINSAQFNFDADELAYISNHWVYLDHDQRVSASIGGTYTFGQTTFTVDSIVGSGLRSGFANTDRLPWYTQVNLGVIHHFNFNNPLLGKFDGRLLLINAFNRVYELRDGSGIGVGAPQYGPRIAVYAGITRSF
ncbi:TonB-dependent receptor [Paraburkholderia sp.]|uniref:TonB-dependent receptor n=1 Tax=Paraburkholderia sp. TaxID=1926495 RepID=UPI0039E2411F